MPIADSKKAQTVVNLLHDRVVQPIERANAVVVALHQAIIDNGLTGQFTAGELTALQAFVTNLSALAGSTVVAAINARYVETHRAQALIIGGVNDGS